MIGIFGTHGKLIILGLLVSFLWALNAVTVKYILGYVDLYFLLVVNGIMFSIGFFIIGIVYYDKVKTGFKKLNTRIFILILLNVVFLLLLPNTLFMYLMNNYKTSLVTALTYSCPLFGVLLAYLLINENINTKACLGVAAIVFGVIMIALSHEA